MALFGTKKPNDPELIRLTASDGGPNKAELAEVARCEEFVSLAIGAEKPLVLLSDPGMGVTVVTDDSVSFVDRTGLRVRLSYAEIVETTILETEQGTSVLIISDKSDSDPDHFDVRHLANTIHAGVSSTDMARRVCSCLLYTSPSPRDLSTSRMPSSA